MSKVKVEKRDTYQIEMKSFAILTKTSYNKKAEALLKEDAFCKLEIITLSGRLFASPNSKANAAI